jgi:predicted TIM-barrel fold metal-dependent hydrolase
MIVCDSHVHVFGPLSRYPAETGSPYPVPDATPGQLLERMDGSGVTHAVVVHAATSGRDNRRTLDLLQEYPDRFRGVIVPPPEAPDDATLLHWHRLGVRGVRFSYTRTAQPGMALDPTLAARIAELGWHAQVHLESEHLAGLAGTLAALPCRVVIDHMGRIPARHGLRDEAFAVLQGLVDGGNAWVKLSAPMRMSSESAPPYADVAVMARALVRQAPQRMLWGSDWPHVNLQSPAPPYAALRRMLDDWAPDAGHRRLILADNPALLYSLSEPDRRS